MPLASSTQLTIEKTPSYYITKEAPKRIYEINPAMKLLVVVRNPVTRAISGRPYHSLMLQYNQVITVFQPTLDYTQTVSKRPGMKSFEEMAFKDPINRVVNTSWGAIKIGLYYRHLKRWLKYFSPDQFHFVSGELLISEPAAEMQRVERFLGLKPVISAAHFHYNPAKGFPCLSRNASNDRTQLHCLGKTKGRAHPHISPDVIGTLASFFEPFNRRFYSLTGRNFGW